MSGATNSGIFVSHSCPILARRRTVERLLTCTSTRLERVPELRDRLSPLLFIQALRGAGIYGRGGLSLLHFLPEFPKSVAYHN